MKRYLQKLNKKQAATLLLLLLGLVTTVYLVGQRTILTSRANEQLYNSLEVTDAEGNVIDCSSGSCETKTLNVEIRLNREALGN